MPIDLKGTTTEYENIIRFRRIIFQFLLFGSTIMLFTILVFLNILLSNNLSEVLPSFSYTKDLTVIFGILIIIFIVVIYLILIPIIKKKKSSQEIFGIYIIVYILGVESIGIFGFFIGFSELFLLGRIVNWNLITIFFIIALLHGIWLYKKEIKSILKLPRAKNGASGSP